VRTTYSNLGENITPLFVDYTLSGSTMVKLLIAGEDAHTSDEQLCRKDTGERNTLQKWSQGHQFVVRGGGHIVMWQPLYM